MNKPYKSRKDKPNRDCGLYKIAYNTFNSLLNVILFIPCCIVRTEIKKQNFRDSGYTVDPPADYFFNPGSYSKTTHRNITTYTQYGKTYNSYQDI